MRFFWIKTLDPNFRSEMENRKNFAEHFVVLSARGKPVGDKLDAVIFRIDLHSILF